MLIDVSTNLRPDVAVEQHLGERYKCSLEEKEKRRICSRHRRKAGVQRTTGVLQGMGHSMCKPVAQAGSPE